MLSLRVELKTSRLLNGCSNQLSYESSLHPNFVLLYWNSTSLSKKKINSPRMANALMGIKEDQLTMDGNALMGAIQATSKH
jgi:hypothetical protein